MKRIAIGLIVLSFGATLPASHVAVAASTKAETGDTTKAETGDTVVRLNEQQKQIIIKAALGADTRQKTPKEFSPRTDRIAPRTVALHAFKPPVTQEHPLLKNYWYALLDAEIVLVGARSNVVAVIPLPQELVARDKTYHGAADPPSTTGQNGQKPSSSVPSHTSPETIK
jgi:hypothetical protein